MFERDGYRAIFFDEAGDANVATLAHLLEGGMVVAKGEKLFQVTCLLTDIDELIFGVVAINLFHCGAIGAAFHDIYFNHSLFFLRVINKGLACANPFLLRCVLAH